MWIASFSSTDSLLLHMSTQGRLPEGQGRDPGLALALVLRMGPVLWLQTPDLRIPDKWHTGPHRLNCTPLPGSYSAD